MQPASDLIIKFEPMGGDFFTTVSVGLIPKIYCMHCIINFDRTKIDGWDKKYLAIFCPRTRFILS